MNRFSLAVAIAALAVPSIVFSETNVNISIGVPAIAVPAPPRIVLDTPPLFLSPSNLGFYIGVDIPYDLVFISGRYYLFQGNQWYRARHYNGPWAVVRHEHLPHGIKKYKIDKIRHHRDLEYRSYQHDHDHYRGRKFRPDKYERKLEKEERKREKHEYKHDRHEKDSDHEHRHDRGKHRGHED